MVGPISQPPPSQPPPIEHGTCHLERRYDVVVVGSGPAGSVVACRLAQSGRRVAVLERGGVHQPGSFPECPADLLKGTQLWRNGRRIGRADALFDLRVFDDVMVLTGCGVGGTSLINAGVSVLPTPEVLADRRWPAELRNDPEWPQDVERVGDTVGTATLPDGRTPNKLTALESMGPTPGIDGQVSRAPLNVAFCDGPNAANEPMVACNGCGNCMTGCNVGAKETYDRNYLSLARTNGAHVFSSCSVKRVEATAHGWALVVCDTRRPGSCRRVEADRVVLAAGALGSTEILLRSRAEGLDLSDMVGHRFSGNGDLIAWGFDTDADADGVGLDSSGSGWLGVGPTITGVLSPTPAGDSPDVAGASSADDRGSNEGGGDPATDAWLMEDGTVPRAFAALTPVLLALSALLDRLPVGAGLEGALGWMRSIFDGPYRGAVRRTTTTLYMSADDSEGEVRLSGEGVEVRWPGAGDQRSLAEGAQRLADAARELGGLPVGNPGHRGHLGNRPVSVHPLGGAVMGSDAADGVVNHRGEVFAGQCGHATHAGLYVTDGSVIPRSLGANPSLTIAALAERTARLMVAEMNALDGGASGDAADGDLLPAPAVVGPEVRFREKLGGHLMVEGQATPITLTLKVAIEDAAAVRNDPSGTELRVTGTVEAPLLHPAPMTVTWGTLRLAVEDADHAVGHRMEYRLGLRDADGVRYRLEADKLILDQPGLDWLWDATEVALVIYPDASGAPPATPEASGRGEIHAYGMARLAPFDAVRLGLSLRGSKGAPPAQQVRSVASFLHGFGRPMARTFGKSAVQGLELRQAAAAPPRRRALSLPEPERHWLGRSGGWATEEPDDPVVLLRRYAGGGAGPVLLAPGFGMSADHYLLDADPPNLTEFLVDAGHDVWLFDYRSSILFPGAGEQLNLDEIATLDWPAAVDRVRTVAGAETVQVVAHCVGSATVLMALLAGMDGVGAVVCSQMSAHFDVPSFTRFRAKLRPGPKLTRMGFRSVVPPDDDGLTARGMDLAVRANPLGHGQRCDSPICRWVFFFYGPTHHHANLDRHTHDRIAELFGEGSLWGMDHVGSMFNKGRLVDAQGGDVYLPKVASLDLPILFLAGTRNRLVLPSSSARTLAWLRSHHGPGLHRRVELPGYAHLDGLLGRRAHQDVFPHILSFLNEH